MNLNKLILVQLAVMIGVQYSECRLCSLLGHVLDRRIILTDWLAELSTLLTPCSSHIQVITSTISVVSTKPHKKNIFLTQFFLHIYEKMLSLNFNIFLIFWSVLLCISRSKWDTVCLLTWRICIIHPESPPQFFFWARFIFWLSCQHEFLKLQKVSIEYSFLSKQTENQLVLLLWQVNTIQK